MNDFEHDIRNPLLGVALEVKRIMGAIQRIEKHCKRMQEACEECIASAESQGSGSGPPTRS